MSREENFTKVFSNMEHLTKTLQRLDSRLKSIERQPTHLKQKRSNNSMHHKEYWEAGGREYGGCFNAVQRRNPREVHNVDHTLGSIKPKLPMFYGSTNPKEYIQWEHQVERVFDSYPLSEEQKVKLIVAKLRDYAITWWDKLFLSRRRNLEHPIDSWYVLKPLMREHFVPKCFYKLRSLRQGSKSVEAYYMEMQMLLEELNLYEDEEATMDRFLRGLKKEIVERLDPPFYEDLEGMVHIAIKIEKYLQRKSARYTKPKSISKIHLSLENVSLPTEIKTIVEVESDEIQNDIVCDLVPIHADNILFSRQLEREVLFDCNTSTIVTPTPKEAYVDVCELGKKAHEVRTKACELIENESFVEMREKHEISLWHKQKNERKAKNVSLCEIACEVNYVLFSKQNILDLLYKGTCYLTRELKPCLSSVSFEVLQEAKRLIEKLESMNASKVQNASQHMVYKVEASREKQKSKFASKFIHGSNHTSFKPSHWVWRHYWKDRFCFEKKFKRNLCRAIHLTSDDFKSALHGEFVVYYIFNAADFRPFDVGDRFDSRTNPFEEGEDDMNQSALGLHL